MLRAFVDVNLPKFLSADVQLFNGILGDLFPAITYPEVRLSSLLTKPLRCAHSFGWGTD